MNTQIFAAWKPLAALGLALALAGCNGTNSGGVGGASGGGGNGETLATVGGTPITRAELTKILEAQSGAQYLPILIDTQLLIQDGKDKGIEVSDADVTAELERQKSLNPELAAELTKNPKLSDLFKTQVRRTLVSQRLLTKDVKATDADVQKFFTTYKAYYEKPAQVKVGTLLTSTKARADAMSRALKGKTKTFEQLVAEQKKAQDPLASNSSAGEKLVPVDTLGPVYGEAEAKSIEKLPKGGTTDPKEIKIGPAQQIYVLFHVSDKQESVQPDLATMKSEVETDYKMAQIAMKEVKKNPENPPFEETLKRTRDAIRQQQQQEQMQRNPMDNTPVPPPSLRDVLTIILRPLQQNILTDLRSKGTVKIEDSSYTEVADQYKTTPTPVPPGAATAGAATAGAATAGAATAGAATAGAATAGAATNSAPAPAAEAPAANAPANSAAPAPATP